MISYTFFLFEELLDYLYKWAIPLVVVVVHNHHPKIEFADLRIFDVPQTNYALYDW